MSPERVGICAMELYFPRTYVEQDSLEQFDGVTSGKYTVGLGQQQMAFCSDAEDIVSVCATVVAALIRNSQIDVNKIGFVSVGTETLIDKSKSVKSALMNLFCSNRDIEGIDVKNACFGGTQALFHAVDWIYANWQFEERYAIAVMGDIAVYESGPARCTGGAGSFAALIGPNALVTLDRGLRAMHVVDVWDFYKPINGLSTEYPTVDGVKSLESYFSCLDEVYRLFCSKAKKICGEDVDISTFDAVLFHCPFTRLVQKALGRLVFEDFKRGVVHQDLKSIEALRSLSLASQENQTDRNFVKITLEASEGLWRKKTEPYVEFNRRIGNMYTSSLYAQLVALFHQSTDLESLSGNRILFYSYGSGAVAAMFSARIENRGPESVRQYKIIKESADAAVSRLDQRSKVTPEKYTDMLSLRERLIETWGEYVPTAVIVKDEQDESKFFSDTFFISSIDSKCRRHYSKFPK